MFARFRARQLANPSGVIGTLLIAPLWNRRNAALNDLTFDRLSLHARDRVLEVGFGGGYLLGRMAAVVTDGLLAGVDTSRAMVALCGKRYRPFVASGTLEVRRAPAGCLPYPDRHFSKACTVNSIFYWEDAPRAFAELYRVLDDKGMLVLCFTCRSCLEGRKFARHGLRLYDEGEVRHMMAWAGFAENESIRAADRHREFLCLRGRKV